MTYKQPLLIRLQLHTQASEVKRSKTPGEVSFIIVFYFISIRMQSCVNKIVQEHSIDTTT